MPTQKSTYVTVISPSGPKTLFRYFELPDNSLCLEVIAGDHPRYGTEIREDQRIVYQKFSIHPTKTDPTICTVTFRQEGHGTEQSIHKHSEALKRGQTIHLLSKRFSDMAAKQYTPKKNRTLEPALLFDPKMECLTGHIYTRAARAQKTITYDKLFRSWTVCGKEFCIDILFNKLPFPALPTGFIQMSPLTASKSGMVKKGHDLEVVGLSGSDSILDFAEQPRFLDKIVRQEFFHEVSQRASDPSRAYALMLEIYGLCGPTHGAFFQSRIKQAYWKIEELWSLMKPR